MGRFKELNQELEQEQKNIQTQPNQSETPVERKPATVSKILRKRYHYRGLPSDFIEFHNDQLVMSFDKIS